MKARSAWSARIRADRTLSRTALLVAWHLRDHGNVHVESVARDLQVTPRAVSRALGELVRGAHVRVRRWTSSSGRQWLDVTPIEAGVPRLVGGPRLTGRGRPVARDLAEAWGELFELGLVAPRAHARTADIERDLADVVSRHGWTPYGRWAHRRGEDVRTSISIVRAVQAVAEAVRNERLRTVMGDGMFGVALARGTA